MTSSGVTGQHANGFAFGATSGAGASFDHALFANYAAALGDGKAFGSNGAATTSGGDNAANLAAGLTDPGATHHHQ